MHSDQKNFAKALGWVEDLRTRYLHMLACFRIYERFRKLTAVNVVGKRKAEINSKTFNRHLYFFLSLQEAARCYFFIELAKFFDKNRWKQSLTIGLLLDFVEKNLHSFSTVEFLKYHTGRDFIPELFADYKPLTSQDIKKMRRRLQWNKELIKRLKVYRDKYLVHDDLKKMGVKITGIQVKTLLKIIQDTIDLFYLRLEFSLNVYSNYDKEPALAVDRVMQALQEHEKDRRKKLKEQYGF